MAEPISQVVASMPRARFVALMALFLGPAVAVYTLFSIYPLIATMGLVDLHERQRGRLPFRRARQFCDAAHGRGLVEAVLERGQNNLIFFSVHMAVQNPIGIALAGLLSLPGLKLKGLYRTHHLPADDAVRGHRRLRLESDPLAAVGRRGRRA